MARAPELGVGDATPVLIIGMPRSHPPSSSRSSPATRGRSGGELNSGTSAGPCAPCRRPGTETSFLAKAARDYLGVLRAIGPRGGTVTDKMPFNFLWAGCPPGLARAVIIHCRRTALDTALSIHQTTFIRAWRFPREARAGGVFRSLPAAHDHWRRVLPAVASSRSITKN